MNVEQLETRINELKKALNQIVIDRERVTGAILELESIKKKTEEETKQIKETL